MKNINKELEMIILQNLIDILEYKSKITGMKNSLEELKNRLEKVEERNS